MSLTNPLSDNYLYGVYRNEKFSDVFPDYATFLAEYEGCGLPTNIRHADPVSPSTDENSLKTLYLLLVGRFMSSTIASDTVEQFKIKLFSIIYEYGPNWEKQLDYQKKIRAMTDDDILTSSTVRHYHGFNPTSEFTIGQDVNFVNEQNTQLYKKNKGEAYALADGLLDSSITENFLRKFKKLFLSIVNPEFPQFYGEVGAYHGLY